MERDSAGRFRGRRGSRSESVYASSAQPSTQRCGSVGATAGLLSLIGGAAVGAVAMYLMDPNHGEERRGRAMDAAQRALEVSGEAARSAYHGTSHVLENAWHAASDKAADVASAAQSAMPSGKDVRKAGERLLDHARDLASSAASSVSDTAGSWMDSARRMLPQSAHLERHSEYAMNPTGVSLTALSTLAIGAGAMWLLDSSKGRGRRAWLGQKATRFLNEIGTFSRATGRHLGNKAKGYYHETSSAVRDRVQGVADSSST